VNKVLIVTCGEYGEGGVVCGVFWEWDMERATALALSQRGYLNRWIKEEDSDYEALWSSGCDWVRIEKWDITIGEMEIKP